MHKLKASMDQFLRLQFEFGIMLNLKYDVCVQDYFNDLQIMMIFGTLYMYI